MAQGTTNRSIDDIIGSIRSIVETDREARGVEPARPAANDDVGMPVDLTDLPSGGRSARRPAPKSSEVYAEPFAAPFMADEEAVFVLSAPLEHTDEPHPRVDGGSDAGHLAEIAATVERNLEWMSAPKPAFRETTRSDAQHAKFEALKASMDKPVAAPPAPVQTRLPQETPAPTVVANAMVPMPGSYFEPIREQHVEGVEGAAAASAPDPLLDEAMLRPIIREWLDDNLPPLVERLVREELEAAISGRASKPSR